MTFVHPKFVQASYIQATFVPVTIATTLEVVNISSVISVQIEPNLHSSLKRPAFIGNNFHLEISQETFVQQTFDISNTTAESNINALEIQFILSKLKLVI